MATNIKQMENKQLEIEYNAIIEMIEVSECFGVRDLIYRDLLEREIDRRGLQIKKTIELVENE